MLKITTLIIVSLVYTAAAAFDIIANKLSNIGHVQHCIPLSIKIFVNSFIVFYFLPVADFCSPDLNQPLIISGVAFAFVHARLPVAVTSLYKSEDIPE